MTTQSVSISREAAGDTSWSIGRWVAVNAAGLGTPFALFALFGGTEEALGAEHENWLRDLSLLAAFIIGSGARAYLRQRTLLPRVPRVGPVGAVTIIALTAGFVGGFVIGGPPLDFILGIFAVGALAGGAEWRILRRQLPRPGRLALVAAVGWLVASVPPSFQPRSSGPRSMRPLPARSCSASWRSCSGPCADPAPPGRLAALVCGFARSVLHTSVTSSPSISLERSPCQVTGLTAAGGHRARREP